MKIILFLFPILLPSFLVAQIITTVDSIGCFEINGIVLDSYGNLFFTNLFGNQVKKIDTNHVVSVIAGTGTSGFSGDGGLAIDAKLSTPVGIALDSIGNIFFSDADNQRIRKIDVATGIISTIAGTGVGGSTTGGFFGDGGPASAAQLNEPDGICFDNLGNLYITDSKNYRVRMINSSGTINTIAGSGFSGSVGDGAAATLAKCTPSSGILVDVFGNLYFTQSMLTIRKVNTAGIISTIAGDTSSGVYNGDGILAANAHLDGQWLAMGNDGLLYISDDGNNARIRVIDNSGVIHTVAGDGVVGHNGDGSPATSAEIEPTGLAFDHCGNLYFGEDYSVSNIRKVSFNPACWLAKVPETTTPEEISIYPNPAPSELNIEGVKTEGNYVLFNIVGIIEQTGTLKPGKNSLSIQTLPSGIHILQLTDNNGQKTVRKIVKE